MRKLVISTCGTAILTNGAPSGLQTLLQDTANCGEHDLKNVEKVAIDDRLANRKEALTRADLEQVRKLSAELNGILGMYDGDIPQDVSQDFHVLFCTDTYQGLGAARLVEGWLQNNKVPAQIYKIDGLTTKRLEDFRWGMSDLVTQLESIVPGYMEKGYRVIFNLTGGFKAVQGYLNTLGMLYADEIVYIFEAQSSELIRIPRLPIRLDPEGVIGKHLEAFRKMEIYGEVAASEAQGIPESLLDERKGGRVGLSIWGQAVWGRSKEAHYKEKLLSPPHERLKYGRCFTKTAADHAGTDRMALINRRMDQLGRFLNSNGQENLKTLDFKPIQGNPVPGSTHECDAWADKDAKRIFSHWENNVLVLDELGKKL